MVGSRKFGKKKRLAAPCVLAEERPVYLFLTVPTHRPSVFSYLLPQKFVDLSNQMYIESSDKFLYGLFFL
ncbi:hypothetical protein HMPREF0083_03423 [Aneurinibacillus aneurinilyticus ATCC 12856]|uniref:Uncharacterized protein n=1 Tax=Aneurinibacillus aneurinilyticus ATCC 12856 TaxID=649747 RepID=U1X1R6_ANEAE|nr:hypothetical protein HMPREF0083_03423 [Aneurinibacillus aneurinilyticus ATCC 12856]